MRHRTRYVVLAVLGLVAASLGGSGTALATPRSAPRLPTTAPRTPTPVKVAVRAAASGRAIVSWRPGAGPPTYQYVVQTREGLRVRAQKTVAGTDTVATDLVPGSRYTFAVVPSGPQGIGTPTVSNPITAVGSVAPNAVTGLTANADASTNRATVRWVPPSLGPAPETYNIGVFENFQQVGAFICYAPCNERTVDLTAGAPAWFTVDAANPVGRSAPLVSNPITVSKPCDVACVSVDATSPSGSAKRRGSGFLHSIGPGTDLDVVARLQPKQWRVATINRASPPHAAATGARLTELLSDDWWEATSPGQGGAAAPWADWNLYSSFVTNMVTWIKAGGIPIEYWDVQNEPTAPGYYAPGVTPTVDLLLQQFKVAYQAIKAVDPNAKVVAPSLELWSDHAGESSGRLDMRTFLDFSVLNGLTFDAISFHDIGYFHRVDEYARDWSGSQPEELEQGVGRLRLLLADRPSLGSPAILVNEYTDPYTAALPGWSLGRIAALEAADVDNANRACWFTCGDGYLDGLLAGDGSTTMPNYWVYAFYASMAGERAPVTTTASGVTAFATVADGTVRVLTGRHEGCRPDLGNCPGGSTPAPGEVALTVRTPFTGNATITIAAVPAGNAPLPAPVQQQQITGAVGPNGTVQVTLPQVADGDVWQVTIAPS